MAKRAKLSKSEKIIARFEYLSGMLAKYADSWGENPSERMCRWFYQFNDLKEDNPVEWAEYCKQRGLSPNHDASDCLA